jgi:5-methyltetrahydropteroyltriglutamate--homocysteine methyltransferase
MRSSSDRILTSHVGSLPRPDALIEANRARDALKPEDCRPAPQHFATPNRAIGAVLGLGEYGGVSKEGSPE